MGTEVAQRARDAIVEACQQGLDWIDLSTAVGTQLRRAVGFDGACWHTMDPTTLLLTGSAVTNLPDGGVPLLAECEYANEDVNKWAFLAEQRVPAGRLGAATQGQPELSNRYRTMLHPQDIEGELRASFVDAGGCWGSTGLYRFGAGAAFTEDEEQFVASVAPTIAGGLRRALVLDLLEGDHPSGGTGLIVLGAGDDVRAASPAAEAWLTILADEAPDERGLPIPVLALAARVRSMAAMGVVAEASARVRTPAGDWLLMRATPLRGDTDGLLGIAIEPAGPPEIAQLLIAGYGLTEREQDVAFAVLRGASTKRMADELAMSPHTVQDHLKSIFDKVGVHSRRELVSRIYSEHYLPNVAAGRSPTPGGWFSASTKPMRVPAA